MLGAFSFNTTALQELPWRMPFLREIPMTQHNLLEEPNKNGYNKRYLENTGDQMQTLQKFSQALSDSRSKALIFSLAAVGVVFLLAAGLTGLELRPGEPQAFGWVFQFMDFRGSGIPANDNFLKAIRIIYIIGLVLFPVWIVYMIVNPKARKRFLRDMAVFSFFILMILMIANRIARTQPDEEDQPIGDFGAPGFGMAEEGGFDPTAGPPETIVWIASLAVGLFIATILVLAAWIILRRRRKEESAVERIALEVQNALDDLQAGADLRNVVVRCYSEMVQALKKERNIQRSGNLTPREFEDALDALGFPARAVHDLTHLFETVRYGRKEISHREELIAMDSLSSILDACRSRA
jgi:hypothetical protein